jgi:hypothetical protein
MQLKGKITISATRGAEEFVHLSIEDDRAGCQIVEVRMDFATFGELLTGLTHMDCYLRVFNLDKVGKKREHKQEHVEIVDDMWNMADDQLQELLAPHEKDGWIGYVSDLKNTHKRVQGTNKCVVNFVRWIDDTKPNDQTC